MEKKVEYKDAISAVWSGRAVLFVGSGFSCGADSLDGSKFPTGSSLAKLMCARAELKETGDLRQASSRYMKKKGAEDLVELLSGVFSARNTTTAQKEIAIAPWKGIYTTNYDNILERSAADQGKKLRPIELNDSPRNYKDNSNGVLHINGFVDSLTADTLQNAFKLTSTSYLTEKFRESPWSTIFTRQIMSAHAVFFIGYSLYDMEIQEILYADKTLKDKTFFIEYPGLDDEDVEFSDLNDFGTLLPIGVERFASDLGEGKIDSALAAPAPLLVPGFAEHFSPGLEVGSIHRDADVFDLLLQGRIDESFLIPRQDNDGKSEYLFRRDAYSIAAEIYNKNNIVVTSDLGNGKTVFSFQLTQLYLQAGCRVFWLLDESYDCFEDIEALCSLKEKIVIVIENYARKMDLVEHVSLKRSQNLVLLLTERTSVHENVEESLYYARKIIDVSTTFEVDLNKLTSDDVERVASYLEKYGLWGEMAGLTQDQRQSFIKTSCNSELHGVLLGILKSNHIQRKFSALFNFEFSDQKFTKTLVAAFVLKMLGVSDPAPHTIAALANTSAIFDPRFRMSSTVRQLFNHSQGGLSPKSSVLAEFSLQNFGDAPLLVSSLVQIANSIRKKAFGSEMYWKLYRDMASFKHIQRMLPDKGKRENLILFYEGLREVDVERENPHFWLQYAIARLTFPDSESLSKAKTYLDTALGLAAKKPNYTTTDIETQYARYHLEYAHNTELPSTVAFEEFAIAHQKLLHVTTIDRNRREPFRPIRLYESFFKKYGHSFDLEKVQYMSDAADQMLKHLKLLPYRVAKEQNVRAAETSLQGLRRLSQQRINSLTAAL